MARWSDRALCPGQALRAAHPAAGSGEDAPGPRWQRGSETFRDLEVLARVPEPAVVVLGPPGSGKSTLLGIMIRLCPQALAGQAEADLSQAP